MKNTKLSLVNKGRVEDLLAEEAKAIPPSGIREFFDIVYSMPDCISLGVGEPDFVTPWRISEAGIYSIKEGCTHYTPNKGLPLLRELVSGKIKSETGIEYHPDEEIIISIGVSQGLDIALRSIINPGDEVIIFEPCFVSYPANISLLHGKPVVVPMYARENFRINIEKLKKAVSPRTKAILLNYPSNPTGSTIDKSTLKEIAKIAIEKNLIVLSDEIYSALTYEEDHYSIISIPGMKERTIYLNGFSKAYAMTGWRLGYVAGPASIIEVILKIHQYTALSAPTLAQHAAIEAMQNSEGDVRKMKFEYLKRRNYIVERFNEIGLPCVKPEGAFYAFPDISSSKMSSREFALSLLKDKKVAVVPGNAFGASGENHVRCSYATSIENIKLAMDRIEKFYSKKFR